MYENPTNLLIFFCFVNVDYNGESNNSVVSIYGILCCYGVCPERGNSAGARMPRRLPLPLFPHQLGDGLLG